MDLAYKYRDKFTDTYWCSGSIWGTNNFYYSNVYYMYYYYNTNNTL